MPRELGNGVRICELDTVQSQANRMEASYQGELAGVIPRHVVEAGGHRADLTELPHRVADAAIRATGLAGEIRRCFEAFAEGDALAMARLAPTSLVYGAWDSRDTRVAVPRAIGSRIEAHDVVECTRSAQYTAVFGQDELGLNNCEWKMGSQAGFAPSPATGRLGGVRVRGEIVQSGRAHARRAPGVPGGRWERGARVLSAGPRARGLVAGGRRYHLRSGCALVPVGPRPGRRWVSAASGVRSRSARKASSRSCAW